MPHTVVSFKLSPEDVASYRAGDYRPAGECAIISALNFSEVRLPKEPVEHGQRLRADVLINGIQNPAVIVDRAGTRTVIDGHHRTVLAVELAIECPANIIFCDCPEDKIMANLRCEFIDAYCHARWVETEAAGWGYKALEGTFR